MKIIHVVTGIAVASLMSLTGVATQSYAGGVNIGIGIAPAPIVVAPAPAPAPAPVYGQQPPDNYGPPPSGNEGPPPTDNYGPPPADNYGNPPAYNYAPPPAYAIQEPPPLVVIPGTYVYAVPGPSLNIVFYQGYWWRPYRGYWYRSSSYNGSWAFVRSSGVPRAIITLPPDYRRHLPSSGWIKYGEVQSNWKRWEKEKHWDHYDNRHAAEKNEEMRHDDRHHDYH